MKKYLGLWLALLRSKLQTCKTMESSQFVSNVNKAAQICDVWKLPAYLSTSGWIKKILPLICDLHFTSPKWMRHPILPNTMVCVLLRWPVDSSTSPLFHNSTLHLHSFIITPHLQPELAAQVLCDARHLRRHAIAYCLGYTLVVPLVGGILRGLGRGMVRACSWPCPAAAFSIVRSNVRRGRYCIECSGASWGPEGSLSNQKPLGKFSLTIESGVWWKMNNITRRTEKLKTNQRATRPVVGQGGGAYKEKIVKI